MTSSLVGSEMCIRDSFSRLKRSRSTALFHSFMVKLSATMRREQASTYSCLLYTSDAADDM
eukprot:1670328-Prorocentrum_lima.AAC.1